MRPFRPPLKLLTAFVSFSLVVLLLLTFVAQGQTSSALPPAAIGKIERAITTEMARQNIPGLSVAVVINNQLRWSNG